MIKPKTYALVVFVVVGIGGAWLLLHYKRTAREKLAAPPDAHSQLGRRPMDPHALGHAVAVAMPE